MQSSYCFLHSIWWGYKFFENKFLVTIKLMFFNVVIQSQLMLQIIFFNKKLEYKVLHNVNQFFKENIPYIVEHLQNH